MGKPSKQILAFMEKFGVESDEIWEVHGSTWVVKHKALERVAAEKGIVFDRPAMLETNSGQGIVALVVFGKLGERQEWSIGEASPKNCKNSYYYAMAEKRAKDRVILKLLDTHGALYSESEADEFTQPRQNPHVTRPEDIFEPIKRDDNGHPIDNIAHVEPGPKMRVADQNPIFKALQAEIQATTSRPQCRALIGSKAFLDRFAVLKSDWQEMLRGVNAEHMEELRKQEQGDDMRMTA
jgi:hypothetical protein